MARIARIAANTLLATSWLMVGVSMFLPVSTAVELGGTPPGTPLVGWESLYHSNSILFGMPWLVLFEPGILVFPLLMLATLSLLVMPFVYASAGRESVLLAAILLLLPTMVWLLPASLRDSLLWGVYLWQTAFVIASAACFLRGLGDAY